MVFFELIILGIFIGAITGITGASGVLIMVPIFSTFFDIPLPVILGTSLLVDVIVSISVSFTYSRAKNVDVKGVVWILIGTLLGAQAGSFYVASVSKSLIMAVLTVAMVLFGVRMWQSGLQKYKSKHLLKVSDKIFSGLDTPIGMILCGFLIGIATGIFGAGGGLTIFVFLYSFLRFPIKRAIGTSTFIMLLTALSAVIGYFNNGNLDLCSGLIIGLSAAVGGALSSIFANKINEEFLARIVGAFFIFFALTMFVLRVLFPLFNIFNK